jgi:hypothetical protein
MRLFKVYDIIEALQARFAGTQAAQPFAEALNEFFIEEGIGWQLVDGKIVTRGTEAFEAVVTNATSALATSQRPTAAGHLHEALEALSRRPKPNLPGAAYHAMHRSQDRPGAGDVATGRIPDDPAPGGGGGHQDQDRNHTFRATGITAYLKNKGTLEHAQTLANHASPRTTKLYDRARTKSRSTRWRRFRFKRQSGGDFSPRSLH